jgi:signal transduction histidine kinase/putative methionine-R-sulfoxide reductase with GAF domain
MAEENQSVKKFTYKRKAETTTSLLDWPTCHFTGFPCTTQQRADELETILNIQQAITSHLDLSDVLKLIVEQVQRLTSAQLSLLYVLEGEDFQVAAAAGHPRSDEIVGYHVPAGHSVAGLSIRTGEPIIVDDVQLDDRRLYREAIKLLGNIHSYMTVPLFSGARPVGVIAVADPAVAAFGPDSIRVLSMLAPSAVIGLDNARLYQEQQERRIESEGRTQMAEALRVMVAILNSNRSLDEILDYIVTHVSGRLLDCQAMAVYTLQPGSDVLTIQASHGLPTNLEATDHFLSGHEAVFQAIMTRQPVAISNAVEMLEDETNLTMAPTEWSLVSQLTSLYQSWMVVPLIVKGEVYGAILMYYRQRKIFSEEEIGLAMAFSDQVALAIENAHLRMQAEQTAVLAERNRLARELHDAVSQTLFSTSLIADVLPILWDRNPEEGRKRLEELRQLTRGALAEMRTLLFELRPSALKEAKLGDLLVHLTQAISSRTHIPISLTVDGDGALPPDVQVTFYRITQEALNNMAKYANPSQTSVELHFLPEQVKLTISDNGCGFDPNCVPPEHMGLRIMHERAVAIHADLKLKSQPGKGTAIEVTWQRDLPEEQS